MNNAAEQFEDNSPEVEPEFHGKQDDERILYQFQPHWLRKFITFFQISMVTLGVGVLLWYRGALDFPLVEASQVRSLIYLLLGWVVSLWYAFRAADDSITFLTDRRLVRFDPLPFISRNRRTIFWHEVAKTKSAAGNWLCGLLGVGEVLVIGKHADENVRVKYAYYYEDLGQYIDKLVYLTMTDPQRLKNLNTFITKPKGQRYPQSNTMPIAKKMDSAIEAKQETKLLAQQISSANWKKEQ